MCIFFWIIWVVFDLDVCWVVFGLFGNLLLVFVLWNFGCKVYVDIYVFKLVMGLKEELCLVVVWIFFIIDDGYFCFV